MSRWGKCDFRELERFQRRLEEAGIESDPYIRALSRELAARLLAKVIKRTPVGEKPNFTDDGGNPLPRTVKAVGDSGKKGTFLTREGAILDRYWSGYVGGTLRRGWTAETEEEARSGKGRTVSAQEQAEYIDGLRVERAGNSYRITIVNPVSYGPYVEYGHRQTPGRYVPALGKRLKSAWVPGKYMLTVSMQELEAQAPGLISNKINLWLQEVLTDGK